MSGIAARQSVKRAGAYAYLGAAMCIAGSSVVAVKVLACRLPVFLVGGCSLVIASIALAPVVWRSRRSVRLSRRTVGVIALQALTGMFLFRVLLMHGLREASAVEAGLITSSLPAVTALIAFALRVEKPSLVKGVGVGLTVAGLVAAEVLPSPDAHGHVLALTMVFGAVICEALFTALQKKIPLAVPPLVSTSLVCLIGCVWFLPLAVHEALRFDFGSVNLSDVLYILYYGFIVTALAYFFFYKGARLVPASTAGAFCGLMPLSSLALSHLVLGEAIFLRHVVSLILVLSGIAVLEFWPAKQLQPVGESLVEA